MYESEKECQNAIDGLNKAGLQASFARVGQVRYIHASLYKGWGGSWNMLL